MVYDTWLTRLPTMRLSGPSLFIGSLKVTGAPISSWRFSKVLRHKEQSIVNQSMLPPDRCRTSTGTIDRAEWIKGCVMAQLTTHGAVSCEEPPLRKRAGGWWADAFRSPVGFSIGSKLWTLQGAFVTNEAMLLAVGQAIRKWCAESIARLGHRGHRISHCDRGHLCRACDAHGGPGHGPRRQHVGHRTGAVHAGRPQEATPPAP